ncbi:MAG: hypothetical protein KDA24_04525 [Deltaproteobacteria bacterium]|nr:hypothetical protein [Deltaproteobacteria bacterium]
MGRRFIVGAGCVTWAGLGIEALEQALRGEAPPFAVESPGSGPSIDVGRVGPIKDPASAATYRRWGQVDTYSRYGYVAARLALEQSGLTLEEREAYGVFLGTSYGCMEENQRFDRYTIKEGVLKGASPLVFKGTVDNAPAGWIAVAFKLRGPNATFVSGDGAGAESMWSGLRQIEAMRAPGLLCGGVERFVDLHLVLRERDPDWQGATLSEGSGVVLVEDEAAMRARDVTPLAELVGVVRHRGSITEGLQAVGVRLGLRLEDVGLVSLATPTLERLAEERAELEQSAKEGGHGAALEGIEFVADKVTLGEFHGAWGGVAVCAALTRREPGGWNGRKYALVHVRGEGDESFYVALGEPVKPE